MRNSKHISFVGRFHKIRGNKWEKENSEPRNVLSSNFEVCTELWNQFEKSEKTSPASSEYAHPETQKERKTDGKAHKDIKFLQFRGESRGFLIRDWTAHEEWNIDTFMILTDIRETKDREETIFNHNASLPVSNYISEANNT